MALKSKDTEDAEDAGDAFDPFLKERVEPQSTSKKEFLLVPG